MIPGSRGGPARPLRAVALACLAAAAALVCLAPAASAATGTSWQRAWSWRPTAGALPPGCAAYEGRSVTGVRWLPSLVGVTGGQLRLATLPPAGDARAAGSGIGCTGRAQRYGRLAVRALIPRGAGLAGRIALWPSGHGGGSDWSGLTVPSADLSPTYVTNGCGDEAYGASVPARLTGAFHDYVLTWSPEGFTITVDGRRLYQDAGSYDGPRWPGISLSAVGSGGAAARMLVTRIDADAWTGPVPPDPAPSQDAAPADGDTAAPGDSDEALAAVPGRSRVATPASPPAPSDLTGTVPGGPRAGGTPQALDADGAVAALASAPVGELGAPWLVGGGCVALGVLAGVVRAAFASRRGAPAGR